MSAPTQETIALARQRYTEGVPIARILADTEMSLGTLYLWLDGGPDDGAGPRLPRLPRRRDTMAKRRKPLSGSPVTLVARLWRTAERQVRDIEDRVRLKQQPADERERDARMLAVIVKTVRELRALRDADEEQAGNATDEFDNLDDFRRDLAAKIDAALARRGDGDPGGVQT
jgi:hypothetical protein